MKKKLGIGMAFGLILLLAAGNSFAQVRLNQPQLFSRRQSPGTNIRICTPTSPHAKEPLFIVTAGKKSIALIRTQFQQLDPTQIVAITVHKPGDTTINKYGEKGKWGVVDIKVLPKTFRKIKKASKNESI